MPRKKSEDSDDDIQFIPNLRKSARIASKGESTPSRGNSVTGASSAAPTTSRSVSNKSESVESELMRAGTPTRRGTKKSGSIEPDANVALTPSRRTSARLSMSEHPDNSEEFLELPTPTRRRTTSTSSTGSVTTPRRTTRAAVKALPVLLEVEANEDEALKTPPIEESVLGIPASAQKRHFNLASKLVKMLDSPVKKPVRKVEDNEVVVLPVERESPRKKSPTKESPKKESPKKESPKKESPKKESPKKAESPAKGPASPKKDSPKAVDETPKKGKTPKKDGSAKITSWPNKDDESEDEPMDWEEGPQKTPIVFHPKSAAKSTAVKQRLQQLVPDQVDTPTSRAARRGKISPVKKTITPSKSPVKDVEEEEENEKDEDEDEEEHEDEDEDEAMDEEEEVEENEEEEEEEVEVVESPKKIEKKKKVVEVVEEEEEEDEEEMEDENEEVDEDEEEEEEGGEDDEEDGLFPAVSFKKVFDGSVDFIAALASVYAWAFARGSSRFDDLPGKLVNGTEAETVWQQIDHRNGQITKDNKKAKKAGLFNKDISLSVSEKKKGKKRRAKDEDEDEEQDLVALEEEGYDEEGEEERPKKKKKKKDGKGAEGEKKKFPKSSVDDRFFSLAEMEAAADELEKEGAIEEGILDDGEDEGGDAAYTYDEFFGAAEDADDVFGGMKKGKKAKRSAMEDNEDDSVAVSKKAAKAEARKSVSWADASGEGKLREERLIEASGKMRRLTSSALAGEEDEEQEGGVKEEVEEERILLGPADEEDKADKTPLKGSIKSIKKRIAQLEDENLEARKWDLQGEVGSAQRGENTLLEQHVEFDHGMTRAPTITEDFNEKIEAIVLQRFKDKAWDDPVRTVRQEERTEDYRNKLVDEDLLIKQSLSSVYEKEYEKAQVGADAAAAGQPAVNPKHAEIDEAWTELFGLIDPLFHFNVTPQQAKAEVKVITNVLALQQEEVGAMMSTEDMLIAPEEVKKREKGTLKGKEERDTTDKKRERRKKKQKQRAVVLSRGEDGLKRMLEKKEEEAGENGEPKKKKKKKNTDGAAAPTASAGAGKFKSSEFFTKLQATVQNELVEKTKKNKAKAGKLASNGNSAKFKLMPGTGGGAGAGGNGVGGYGGGPPGGMGGGMMQGGGQGGPPVDHQQQQQQMMMARQQQQQMYLQQQAAARGGMFPPGMQQHPGMMQQQQQTEERQARFQQHMAQQQGQMSAAVAARGGYPPVMHPVAGGGPVPSGAHMGAMPGGHPQQQPQQPGSSGMGMPAAAAAGPPGGGGGGGMPSHFIKQEPLRGPPGGGGMDGGPGGMMGGHPNAAAAAAAHMMNVKQEQNLHQQQQAASPASVISGTRPVSQVATVAQEEIDEEEMKNFKRMADRLKDKHEAQVERLYKRGVIDQCQPMWISFCREVWSGTKKYSKDDMKKLRTVEKNIDSYIMKNSVTNPIIQALYYIVDKEEAEKEKADPEKQTPPPPTAAPSSSVSRAYPDPWPLDVRARRIRVPDFLSKHVRSARMDERLISRRKRHADAVEEEQLPLWSARRMRHETDLDRELQQMEKVEGPAVLNGKVCKIAPEKESLYPPVVNSIPKTEAAEQAIQRRLTAGGDPQPRQQETRSKIPGEALKELNVLRWRLVTDERLMFAEPTNYAVAIAVGATAVPPLHVLIPRQYPSQPATVLFEKSFPKTHPALRRLGEMVEARLATVPLALQGRVHSMAEVYKNTCEPKFRQAVDGNAKSRMVY
eukprot:PDM74719.1 hypothetical protein PRIPAC_43670 [Pristionchus pacificus]